MTTQTTMLSSQAAQEPLSLSEFQASFDKAVKLLDDCSQQDEALELLQSLHPQRKRLDLFSVATDSLDDIATPHLPFLALEYHLAMAHLGGGQSGGHGHHGRALARKQHLSRASELGLAYLRNLDTLIGRSEDSEFRHSYKESGIDQDYHKLMDVLDNIDNDDNNNDDDEDNNQNNKQQQRRAIQVESRDEKIARFRRKRAVETKIESLNKARHNGGDNNDNDNKSNAFGDESVLRDLYVQQLMLHAMSALEESLSIPRELEMLQMAIQQEQRHSAADRHLGYADGSNQTHTQQDPRTSQHEHHPQHYSSGGGGGLPMRPPQAGSMLMTHVTQDAMTGKLLFKKEELQSQVFRPGWNLPTMTLEELGDREVAGAMARSEQQKISEEQNKLRPKRYDQLEKQGLEDDYDLVDASADLDRKWDDFKDANPRGSGNKMGDRGDRNI
jgi:immunoglobulin-binding protein 1